MLLEKKICCESICPSIYSVGATLDNLLLVTHLLILTILLMDVFLKIQLAAAVMYLTFVGLNLAEIYAPTHSPHRFLKHLPYSNLYTKVY